MYIDLTPGPETDVQLRDASVFTEFHVSAPHSISASEVGSALARWGAGSDSLGDDEHVRVRVAWLIENGPSSSEWRGGFDQMVEYAASKGWYDELTNSIRAHIKFG